MATLVYISLGSLLLLGNVCFGSNYYVGVGIADVTGPAADINMMGYANPGQTSHGLHMRQMSRAFIFAVSPASPRVIFVNLDAAWAGGAVKRQVVQKLKKRFGNLYTDKNVCISGTHTHSGMGGYSQYLLFDITALGFNHQTFEALVDGIVVSIVKAHDSMQPADLYVNKGELLESNINRSPTAYLNNPEAERAKYTHNVDKDMVVLKIVSSSGVDIGMISWFAVHCTSMNNTNQMISSDNKGYAAQQFENMFNPGSAPGKGPFVAAFAQSNEGDVSPNTRGPHCLDTGKECDVPTSTCNDRNELCVAFGPGKDMFESTQIIGNNQFKKAVELYNSASFKLSGPVDFRHSFADMTIQNVSLSNGSKVQTCKPSMGYSFAAGTTDGPGAFDFKQGTTTSNPFWNFVRDLIEDPSPELVKCQEPKPILLPTGEITKPYLWQPQIVDTQLLRLGQFVIIAVPGEFSTMSGRRMRDAVSSILIQGGFPANTSTVIGGLCNEYADYITTYEEYQIQRYEGASTTYGPYTLAAYIQLYRQLASAMAKGTPSPDGPTPPNLLDVQLNFVPGVIFDLAPSGEEFGSVLQDANPSYRAGSQVTVRFQSANPRNNLRTNGTFLSVERKDESGRWIIAFSDSYWETRFHWIRTETFLGYSEALIIWDIPIGQKSGTYRIQHFGTSKTVTGTLTNFVGTTSEFQVVAPR
ncbi:neutral ceramidase isoform X1 [Aplysia californica]|uniref:Neutral ceramidase n=1 Tax=Aplysia californica TaxID=6500 RepID=A0ABM0JSU4_APLCA|nr:neutral ceramidase isoform X1 [Aplysia californica]